MDFLINYLKGQWKKLILKEIRRNFKGISPLVEISRMSRDSLG